MPVRSVDAQSPIEKVPDVEKEPGAAEREKKSELKKRVTRQAAHKDNRDTWCGRQQEDNLPEEAPPLSEDEEKSAPPTQDEKTDPPKLDYRA